MQSVVRHELEWVALNKEQWIVVTGGEGGREDRSTTRQRTRAASLCWA